MSSKREKLVHITVRSGMIIRRAHDNDTATYCKVILTVVWDVRFDTAVYFVLTAPTSPRYSYGAWARYLCMIPQLAPNTSLPHFWTLWLALWDPPLDLMSMCESSVILLYIVRNLQFSWTLHGKQTGPSEDNLCCHSAYAVHMTRSFDLARSMTEWMSYDSVQRFYVFKKICQYFTHITLCGSLSNDCTWRFFMSIYSYLLQ